MKKGILGFRGKKSAPIVLQPGDSIICADCDLVNGRADVCRGCKKNPRKD